MTFRKVSVFSSFPPLVNDQNSESWSVLRSFVIGPNVGLWSVVQPFSINRNPTHHNKTAPLTMVCRVKHATARSKAIDAEWAGPGISSRRPVPLPTVASCWL